MVILYILGGLLLLIGLILLLPIGLKLSYDGEFKYKIKVAFISFSFDKKEEKRIDKKIEKSAVKDAEKEKSFFEKLKAKRGFTGAVKELFGFVKVCLEPLKRFLRFLRIYDIRLSVSVVGEDAASTAVDYGIACSGIYPTLSFLEGFTDLKYKRIDIKADFEAQQSNFAFSLKIKSNIIFILIFAIRIFGEYKKFSVRNEL